MRIRFNGTVEQRRSGCGVCGARRVTENKFVMTKQYILPSGQMKTFRAGMVEEVSEEDGEFLLLYDCFEKVEP